MRSSCPRQRLFGHGVGQMQLGGLRVVQAGLELVAERHQFVDFNDDARLFEDWRDGDQQRANVALSFEPGTFDKDQRILSLKPVCLIAKISLKAGLRFSQGIPIRICSPFFPVGLRKGPMSAQEISMSSSHAWMA